MKGLVAYPLRLCVRFYSRPFACIRGPFLCFCAFLRLFRLHVSPITSHLCGRADKGSGSFLLRFTFHRFSTTGVASIQTPYLDTISRRRNPLGLIRGMQRPSDLGETTPIGRYHTNHQSPFTNHRGVLLPLAFDVAVDLGQDEVGG